MNKIKPRGTSAPFCPTFLDRVVLHLFPEQREWQANTGLMKKTREAEPTEVTETEVKKRAKKIGIRKSPGLDGVPGLAIKTIYSSECS